MQPDQPAPDGPPPPPKVPTTVGELQKVFLEQYARELLQGRRATRTIEFYAYYLKKWVDFVGADRPLASLIPFDLERFKHDWWSVVSVQRLHNFGQKMFGIASPFAGVEKPPVNQRTRVLEPAETAKLLRAATPEFRAYLIGMRETLCRPQECRGLRWSQLLRFKHYTAFVLTNFKSKERRKDGVKVRVIPCSARLLRLLERLRRRQRRGNLLATNDDFVFLNAKGRPWTSDGAGQAMTRTCRRCGLADGNLKGRVVLYTMRHTGATNAVANGVRDSMLATLLGHSSTRMLGRYVHLGGAELAGVIEQATLGPDRAAGAAAPPPAGGAGPAGPVGPGPLPPSPAEVRRAEGLAAIVDFTRENGPSRVLVGERRMVSALEAAALGVEIDLIYVAEDGFSLGAPSALAAAAEALGEWAHVLRL